MRMSRISLLILSSYFVSKREGRVSQVLSKEDYLSLPSIVCHELIMSIDSLGNNTTEIDGGGIMFCSNAVIVVAVVEATATSTLWT